MIGGPPGPTETGDRLLTPARRRLLLIVLLWVAAAVLVAVQYRLFAQFQLRARHVASYGGDLLLPSGRWRFWGIAIPLILVTGALVLQYRWSGGLWKKLAKLGLYAMIPVGFVGWVLSQISGAHGFDSITLADGRRFVLAQEPIMTDSVYSLYESPDPLGFTWRKAGELDYSEDGRFIDGAALAVSPDQKWLLVTRGGVWTDCFRLTPSRPVDCAVKPYPYWNDPNFERDMKLRSAGIAALAGIAPSPLP